MKTKLITAATIAVFSTVLIASAGANTNSPSHKQSERTALSHFSTKGKLLAVRTFGSGGADITSLGITATRFLGNHDADAYYTLRRKNGALCYAIGPAGPTVTVGIVSCPGSAFPSAASPVVDLTVWGMDRGDSTFRIITAQGFATDGVASIRFTDATGVVLRSVAVVQNAYRAADIPAGAVHLDALDAQGNVVAQIH